jgi:hypothetical protein
LCAAACSCRPSATAPSARVRNRSRRPSRSCARKRIRHVLHGIDVAARNTRFALTLVTLVRSVLCVLCVCVRARMYARSCMLPRWQVRVCVRARALSFVPPCLCVCVCACMRVCSLVHAPRQQVHVARAFHVCTRTCAPRHDGWARHWTDILLVLGPVAGPGDLAVATNGRSQQLACSSASRISVRT